MKIKGLQKTTLLDYPGKIACTIFLFGCNFRCGFCHNPELVLVEKEDKKTFSEQEILEFLKKRIEHLEGICITGGEPLLTLDKEFLKKIKVLGYLIKIDTNGTNPEKLKDFIENNLVDYVAMDIKSSKEKYSEVVNFPVNLKKIEESIKLISNLENYEFRTTILKSLHDEQEIERIGKELVEIIGKKPKRFVLQAFENKGKLLDNKFENEKNTDEEYLKKLKKISEKYFEKVEIRI